MASNQFENSRISEGTLHSERRAPQDAGTDAEISNMIAEGGPAAPAGGTRMVNHAGVPEGTRGVSAASTLLGHRVLTATGEELGNIEEIMLDLRSGRITYAVLSFSGFPGIANKRFPVPWSALRIDPTDFILDMGKTFEGAPEFDKANWPDMADTAFGRAVHKHYGQPYWESTGEEITAADGRTALHGLTETTPDQRAETRH